MMFNMAMRQEKAATLLAKQPEGTAALLLYKKSVEYQWALHSHGKPKPDDEIAKQGPADSQRKTHAYFIILAYEMCTDSHCPDDIKECACAILNNIS